MKPLRIPALVVLTALVASAVGLPPPGPPDTWLAERLNRSQVVIYFASSYNCGQQGPLIPEPQEKSFLSAVALSPAGAAAFLACFRKQRWPPPYQPPAPLALGQRYRLLLGGGAAVGVQLTAFAGLSGGLEQDLGAIATVVPQDQSRFAASPANVFLVRPGLPSLAQRSALDDALFTPHPSAAQRAAIAQVLNEALREALPKWRAAEVEGLHDDRLPREFARMRAFWTRMDRSLAAGLGHLQFDLQAVRMNGGTVLYRARAAWRVSGEAAGLLVVWLRPRPGAAPAIVVLDASPGRLLRASEMLPRGEPLTNVRGYCGRLLNVIWLPQNRTGLLVFDRGYEDIDEHLSLWRRHRPVGTALMIADGG